MSNTKPVRAKGRESSWATVAAATVCLLGMGWAAGGAEPPGATTRPTTTRPAKVYSVWPFDANEAARRQDETAKALGVPKELDIGLDGNVSLRLALIPAGRFLMGSPAGEKDRDRDENPHEVTLSRPFYLGVYEVTQEQYQAVIGRNPSHFKGARNPVEMVSWEDATAFCKRLSEKTGKTVRLPTEAEWEYACRAGSSARFSFGASEADLHKYGNYCDRSNTSGLGHQDVAHDDGHDKTAPVGSYAPNAFGLFDMHGNLSELCFDWYQDSYRNLKAIDPTGPAQGTGRVRRGGGWPDPARYCRSADRNYRSPTAGFIDYGFRVAVDVK